MTHLPNEVTDYERLMDVRRRINAEWMERMSGLSDVARGEGVSIDAERINGKLLRRSLAAARERGEIDWGVSEETYQFWKGNSGNAKARRRWRRRNVPNAQKMAHATNVIWRERLGPMLRVPAPDTMPRETPEFLDAVRYLTEAMEARVAKPEHFGDWVNGSTWAPGIWAGVIPVASAGATGEPPMRVTKVDREARTITMETLP